MAITASRFFALPPDRVTPELEAAFFSSLKTANNTFKKTDAHRFAEIDRVLAAELAPAATGALAVLDIGISSGTTTLELADALSAAGLDPAIVATDQSFAARIVAGPLGSRALIEPDGHFLQFELFGTAIRAWNRRLDRFTGRALVNAALRRMLRPAAQRGSNGQTGTDVKLVSPRLNHGRRIALREDDVLARNPDFVGAFDLVRAANILNLDYFPEAALRGAIGHLRSYLKGPGSLLLVVRTDKRNGTNNGTLYALRPDGSLEERRRFGSGSEVAGLVER